MPAASSSCRTSSSRRTSSIGSVPARMRPFASAVVSARDETRYTGYEAAVHDDSTTGIGALTFERPRLRACEARHIHEQPARVQHEALGCERGVTNGVHDDVGAA